VKRKGRNACYFLIQHVNGMWGEMFQAKFSTVRSLSRSLWRYHVFYVLTKWITYSELLASHWHFSSARFLLLHSLFVFHASRNSLFLLKWDFEFAYFSSSEGDVSSEKWNAFGKNHCSALVCDQSVFSLLFHRKSISSPPKKDQFKTARLECYCKHFAAFLAALICG
jgi:hypothetical protein